MRKQMYPPQITVCQEKHKYRANVIDWIWDNASKHGVTHETFFHAIDYYGRVIHKYNTKVNPEIVVALLWIAMKMEETKTYSASTMCRVSGVEPGTLSSSEGILIDLLDWKINVSTPFTFLNFYCYWHGLNIHDYIGCLYWCVFQPSSVQFDADTLSRMIISYVNPNGPFSEPVGWFRTFPSCTMKEITDMTCTQYRAEVYVEYRKING